MKTKKKNRKKAKEEKKINYLPLTTYHLPPTTYNLPFTPYHLQPTTYHLVAGSEQRDTRVSSLFVQKWCFSCLERDFSKYCLASIFVYGANFQKMFRIQGFPNFSNTQKKSRWPLLYQLFTKPVHTLTLVEPNQIKPGFVITNDKASYVAKEDSICFFSVAKEAALNKQ